MVNSFAFFALCHIPAALIYCVLCRKVHYALDSTWQRLRAFRVQDATCFDPADRPLVEGNMEAFLKCQGYVDWEGNHRDTMRVFDELVQNVVARAMKRSLGTSPVHLHLLVLLWSLAAGAPGLDITSCWCTNMACSISKYCRTVFEL